MLRLDGLVGLVGLDTFLDVNTGQLLFIAGIGSLRLILGALSLASRSRLPRLLGLGRTVLIRANGVGIRLVAVIPQELAASVAVDCLCATCGVARLRCKLVKVDLGNEASATAEEEYQSHHGILGSLKRTYLERFRAASDCEDKNPSLGCRQPQDPFTGALGGLGGLFGGHDEPQIEMTEFFIENETVERWFLWDQSEDGCDGCERRYELVKEKKIEGRKDDERQDG